MKLIDFHTHPLLKPFNSSIVDAQKKNLWDQFDEPGSCGELCFLVRWGVKTTDKKSQADLSKVTRGGLNGVFFAMGPAERPFFQPKDNFTTRLILPTEQSRKNLASCVTGFCMEKVDRIFERIKRDDRDPGEKGVDYFNGELVPEFQYLLAQEQNTGIPNKFRIAKNYSEFRNIVDNEPNTIAVVLTIEGAHAFGKFEREDFTLAFDKVNEPANAERYKKIFLDNIKTVKQSWGDRSPLFVTLCHHFWNLLSGHCKSMSPSHGAIPGMDRIIDQEANMTKPMTEVGKAVVSELLKSDANSRRILLDVKHMSVDSRKWYYDLVRQRRAAGDNIPIICSHTSVNLFDTMDEAAAEADTFEKDKHRYLSGFSINLSNDEIKEIADSKGIIGIILNEGRMPGELGRKAIKDCGKEMSDAKRDVYVKLIMCNILQIVKVVNKKEAWDLICIGSDFDGVIDPFETYLDEQMLQDLPVHIMQYLSNPQFDLDWIGVTANDIKTKYMFGYNAQQIGEKIASANILLFLERYFHDGYLKKSSNNGDNIIP
jgi:microsomal dipeptidase-like Zn-dependent dipeptidase